MAKRKKRAKVTSKRRATARGNVRKTPKRAHGKKTKQSVRAKTKRAATKKTASRKARAISTAPGVETVIVDVVEEPVPGVITVTEFDETQVTQQGWAETEGDNEA
jgi:hypothetical protein